jgi:hypothetical protein
MAMDWVLVVLVALVLHSVAEAEVVAMAAAEAAVWKVSVGVQVVASVLLDVFMNPVIQMVFGALIMVKVVMVQLQ